MYIHFAYAVSDFVVTTSPNYLLKNALVGNFQTINCTINTVSGVALNSVLVHWMGPNGMLSSNDRIIINPLKINHTNSTHKTFCSFLNFLYLTEEDKGNYTCGISILQKSKAVGVVLEALISKHYSYTMCIYFTVL